MNKKLYFTSILQSYNINAECINYHKVNHIAFYDILLSPGAKLNALYKVISEISLALKVYGDLIIRPISHLGIIQIEVMEELPQTINLLSDLCFKPSPSNYVLPIYLGQSSDGQDIWMEMCNNPHLLVGGCTGSGKSTVLRSIIANLLFHSNAEILLIDTKGIEFNQLGAYFYNIKIINSYTEAVNMMENLLSIMNYRYAYMQHTNSSPSLSSLRALFSPIVCIIDEFADLITQDEDKSLFKLLCKITQKCRGAHIYFTAATQRPSVDIFNGTIKSNFPARISCKVASGVDSKIILDTSGAESLIGKGDSIIKTNDYDYVRFQAGYISLEEILGYNNEYKKVASLTQMSLCNTRS